jgi:hypothetical protein
MHAGAPQGAAISAASPNAGTVHPTGAGISLTPRVCVCSTPNPACTDQTVSQQRWYVVVHICFLFQDVYMQDSLNVIHQWQCSDHQHDMHTNWPGNFTYHADRKSSVSRASDSEGLSHTSKSGRRTSKAFQVGA